MQKVSREEVYEALRNFQSENGYPPTLRELAAIVGLNKTAVYQRMKQLVAIGAVKKSGYRRTRTYSVSRMEG